VDDIPAFARLAVAAEEQPMNCDTDPTALPLHLLLLLQKQ
jgi:hypothetical protein